MKQGPCLNCESRVPGCHSRCEAYSRFKAAREREKELVRQFKAQDAELYGYRSKRYKIKYEK